ncbi:MAG: helix-turn-helix transcriptional regulator [Thermoleophilaceae bacterium]|nr:helix-turn-helix transcriptional regulator [Thermoleophilaceae bacterium]
MAEPELARRMGALLRRLRDDLSLSQEALADRAGLHATYVGNVERGEKNITVVTLARVLDALGLTLAQFFARLEQQQNEP